jgi:citrate lyase subunit beta/citryl-CoA lyase
MPAPSPAQPARRPAALCRSWLFLPGADERALATAAASGADVLIQELEDFTPPALRPRARALAPALYDRWRAAGALAAVRVNPLDGEEGHVGGEDLAAAMRGRPDFVLLPKVSDPGQIERLDSALAVGEAENGIPAGSTPVVPNIELARGLVRTIAIATASPRVVACLVAAEDMAADLGAERAPDGLELAYVRQRFLVECVAAGVVAIDAPYTWRDEEGLERDTRWARRLGYKAKSCVVSEHAAAINRALTPDAEEIARATRIVAAFEAARARGHDRAEVDGSLVEVPTYANMKRLLARAAALSAAR